MTEYEAYDTLMSQAGNAYQLMFGFFGLVFAFIVMSHVAARKISGKLVSVIIAIYTLAVLQIVINFYVLNIDLDNLYAYMMQKKLDGTYDMSWFGSNPLIVPKILTVLQVLLGVGGYVGSIFFFFQSRKESPGN